MGKVIYSITIAHFKWKFKGHHGLDKIRILNMNKKGKRSVIGMDRCLNFKLTHSL